MGRSAETEKSGVRAYPRYGSVSRNSRFSRQVRKGIAGAVRSQIDVSPTPAAALIRTSITPSKTCTEIHVDSTR